MAWRDRVADTALDFDAQNEGVQHGLSGQAALFCQGECGWSNRRRGMDDCPQMRVIVVEQVCTDRVDKCGAERIESLGAASTVTRSARTALSERA
jgi:hypothetical protein